MTCPGDVQNRSVLFRVCSVPLETFALKGTSFLFELLHSQANLKVSYIAKAAQVVGQLDDVINKESWTRTETKALGALRHRISRLSGPREKDLKTAFHLLNRYTKLSAELLTLLESRQRLDALEREIETAFECETAAKATVLWEACRGSREICEILKLRNPSFYEECRLKGSTTSHWEGKKGRHRAKYLKRILQRATFRTVPRDWHTMVVSLPVEDAKFLPVLRARKSYRAVFRPNVHRFRESSSPGWSEGDTDIPLSLASVSWQDGGKVGFCTSDWENPSRVREVSLTMSPFFRSVFTTMAGRVVTQSELKQELEPKIDKKNRDVLPGFVDYLMAKGVIQACPVPTPIVSEWGAAGRLGMPALVSGQDGFLEVYSKWDGAVSKGQIERLETGVAQMARLSLLIDKRFDVGSPVVKGGVVSGDFSSARQPVLEIIRKKLLASAEIQETSPYCLSAPQRRSEGSLDAGLVMWSHVVGDAGEATSLHGWLADKLAGQAPIQLSRRCLDAFGAPDWDYPWPCDAIVRMAAPDADSTGVFEGAFAAGSLDARFLAFDGDLGLGRDNFEFYRVFLQELSSRTGVEFVELLFPPMAVGAANAIMRPDYGLRWTGDPAAETYYPGAKAGSEFIPLDHFEFVDTEYGRRLLLNGKKVVVMHHATRRPIAPWNSVTDLMLEASPSVIHFSPRSLQRLLDAFPSETHAPRLELEGGLVCSCEQWRISAADLWNGSDHKLDKLRRLAWLRDTHSLPRFLFVSPAAGVRARPVDLQDPDCIHTIEAIYGRYEDPLFIAQTPDAASAFMKDGPYTYSSSAQIRLPWNTGPAALAERIASRFSAVMALS